MYRFARETLPAEHISARKFLEAAQNSQDAVVFYSVYKYFQQRNQRARGNPAFLKGNHLAPTLQVAELDSNWIVLRAGEHCETYTRHFRSLYGEEMTGSGGHLTESLPW